MPHAPLTRLGTCCSGTRDLARVTHVCCTLRQWRLTLIAAACLGQAQATGLAGTGYPARLALAEAAADMSCSTAREGAHVRVEFPSLLNNVAAGCHPPPLPAGARASEAKASNASEPWRAWKRTVWRCLACQATWQCHIASYTTVCTEAAEKRIARHTPEPGGTRAALRRAPHRKQHLKQRVSIAREVKLRAF